MARFYTYPLNYHNSRTTPAVCADNKYDTFTNESLTVTCTVDTEGDAMGDARKITDIFVKCKFVSAIQIASTGWTTINKQISDDESVTNDSGESVSIIDRDGFQNILIPMLDSDGDRETRTAVAVALSFTSETNKTAQIHEVLILEELLRIEGNNRFRTIDIDEVDLSIIHTSGSGKMTSIPPINNERDKWSVNFIASGRYFPQNDLRENIDKIRHFMRNNKNFTFAPEITRYPGMIAPAIFPEATRQMRLLTRNKKSGRSLRFSVRES